MKMQNGFTLGEMLAVVSIVGITLATGVPYINKMITTNRISTQTNGFIALMNHAKSEAIKRSATVSVCPQNAKANGCSTNWSAGYISFVDKNSNGSVDPGDTILRSYSNTIAGNKVSVLLTGASTVVSYVGYTSSGSSEANNAINFTFCYPTADNLRILTLTPVGQLKYSTIFKLSKNSCN